MRNLLIKPWTWGLVLPIGQLLCLFFLPDNLSKAIATLILAAAGLGVIGLEKNSRRSFVIGIVLALWICTVFIAYVKIAKFFHLS